MSTNSGRPVNTTFSDLLKIENSGNGLDGTARNVESADGTQSPLRLSSSYVDITALQYNGKIVNLGANALTFTTSGTTNVTIPLSGTLATLAGSETLAAKTLTAPVINNAVMTAPDLGDATADSINGVNITGTSGKTLTVDNSITLTGTDGSSVDVGTGGTVLMAGAGAAALGTTTGSGNIVLATSPTITSPTLTTPALGVATATSINKVIFTAPATGCTVTVADGKTLTASNTLTFTGTDSSSVNFKTGGNVVYDSTTTDAFTAFTPGFTGFSVSPSSVIAYYKIFGKICYFYITMAGGTSNATTFTITNMPASAARTQRLPVSRAYNNSVFITTGGASVVGTTITCTVSDNSNSWTNSGTKLIELCAFYEIA